MLRKALTILLSLFFISTASAQSYNEMDVEGNITQRDENRNFNPHGNNDEKKEGKVVPKGIYVWTVDRKFGDIRPAEVDTMPHLYPESTLGTGKWWQYDNVGSNYTARQSRIFADRPINTEFLFADAYDQVLKNPDEWHFTNTLSPITNLGYDNCGDKTNGEDHLDAHFAVNAGKRTGLGFDLNYAYARGYFQNQNISHFGATLYGSHLGERYQLHVLFNTNHQKASENGGITDDNYITHPERYTESYTDNEIPTQLDRNWNRNDNKRLFLTHRYSVGFYRLVPMTEEEIKARQEAMKAQADSIEAHEDSISNTMKRVFVPVTSFIHTFDASFYNRVYQAYYSPSGYYADTFYDGSARGGYLGDSIYDKTKQLNIRNTAAIALLEGFNRYAQAGIKVFATHELRRMDLPDFNADSSLCMRRWTEHNVSIGGQLSKTEGRTLHYNLMAEAWLAGEDAGQMRLDATADLNFPLFGDTVQLAAKGYIHRQNPSFYYRHYHSKHLWWDLSHSKETRTRVEGTLNINRSKTRLRVAVEEIQNYTYLGMAYDVGNNGAIQNLAAMVHQHDGNLNVITAQLDQQLKLGPLHWDNIVTYQSSSNDNVLPLPTLNVFSNLYLEFMVARVLRVELGAAATWFTKYDAPDFCPQLNRFAVQDTEESRVGIGNFPFVDAYANLHLKHARFFVMMHNVTGTSLDRRAFLAPHYPQNRSVLHMGVSWNFFN